MGATFFYHLTRRPLEAVLPDLLARSRERGGWKVIVRGGRRMRRGLIGWTKSFGWGPEDQFLGHGQAGGEHDALQPVLLTADTRNPPNGASCLMAVDGAEISAQEVTAMERACILFDGNDAAAVSVARVQWKTLTDAGCEAQYWSEESGRWEMKAKAGGA